MAKWPNVPAVYGWLSLSRRGEWRIKGEKISNPIVSNFINRNYTHDDRGRWFFQNGPQRVYVSLEYTPLVYRFANNDQIETHTGNQPRQIQIIFIDETGSLLLKTSEGIGLVDDRDLNHFLLLLVDQNKQILSATALELLSQQQPINWHGLYFKWGNGFLPVENIQAANVAESFDFDPNPRQAEGDEECY